MLFFCISSFYIRVILALQDKLESFSSFSVGLDQFNEQEVSVLIDLVGPALWVAFLGHGPGQDSQDP